jgi:dihydrolipoamide dehydrogenase
MPGEIHDLIVIGAGPGGYVAAIRAAQLGMKVVVVDKRSRPGGVCLNEGCIPSKALLDSTELFAVARDKFADHGIIIDPPQLDLARMMSRKEDVVRKLTDGVAFLLRKNRIELLYGSARLTGALPDEGHGVEVTTPEQVLSLKGKRVLLATGSEAAEVPLLPFDGNLIINARDALGLTAVPEHLLVIGAGYIGLELGSVWRRLGSRVTVIEMLPVMLPNTDGNVAQYLMRCLKKQGISFRMETKVVALETNGSRGVVTVESHGATEQFECDRILVAAGRKVMTAGLGMEKLGVECDRTGRVRVDGNYATTVPGIFAIGDIIPGPMLAHRAMEEGVVFAERLAGQASQVEYEFIPGIIYTWPEAASVGKSEEQLKADGIPYATGKFSFLASGRAKCMDETEGFVKILAHQDTGRVLGIHIVGPRASDMIAEAVTVMTYGGSALDIAMTFHAHPTLSEAMKEAALDVEKRAIHA